MAARSASAVSRLALLVCLRVYLCSAQTGPNFCSYDNGVFTCSYASMGTADRPIDYSQFSVPPQRLVLTVNGFVPFFGDSRVFSESFSTMDTSQFDGNYPASLTLQCPSSGSIFFVDGAFYNMSYVQHLKITNCNTYSIPNYLFEDIAELDYLGFENGIIDSVSPNGMAGLDVKKLTSDPHQFPRNLGKFEILNTKFVSKVVPPGLLYNWKFLSEVTLKGADIQTITTDVFLYNQELRMIDLSDNLFTTLPENIFAGLNNLTEVIMYNIDWNCACANLWFIDYARDNGITLRGDFVCANVPSNTIYRYWKGNCVETDICDGKIGFSIGKHCQNFYGVAALVLSTVAIAFLILILIINVDILRNIPEDIEDPDAAAKYRKRIGNRWRSAACRIMMRNRREDRERGDRLMHIMEGRDERVQQPRYQKQQPKRVALPTEHNASYYQLFSPAQMDYSYPGEVTPENEFMYNWRNLMNESSPFGGISVPRRSDAESHRPSYGGGYR